MSADESPSPKAGVRARKLTGYQSTNTTPAAIRDESDHFSEQLGSTLKRSSKDIGCPSCTSTTLSGCPGDMQAFENEHLAIRTGDTTLKTDGTVSRQGSHRYRGRLLILSSRMICDSWKSRGHNSTERTSIRLMRRSLQLMVDIRNTSTGMRKTCEAVLLIPVVVCVVYVGRSRCSTIGRKDGERKTTGEMLGKGDTPSKMTFVGKWNKNGARGGDTIEDVIGGEDCYWMLILLPDAVVLGRGCLMIKMNE